MIKQKLPENWIAVSSKTHVDRIYYFNVKTNRSSWSQPSIDERAVEPALANGTNHEGRYLSARTPERDAVEDETDQRQSGNKRMKTPGRKEEIQGSADRRAIVQNKPSTSRTSYAKSKSDKTSSSSKSSSLKLNNNNNIAVSSHKSNNEKKKFAQKMIDLRETLQSRVLVKFNQDKRMKNVESKQQNSSMSSKMSMKIQERRGELNNNLSRNNKIEHYRGNQKKETCTLQGISRKDQRCLKKNLARDRMQRFRRSLEKDKLLESCHTNKVPPRFNKSLPLSQSNNDLESKCVYKNADVRLTRLHNRILKDATYKRNGALKSNTHNELQISHFKTPTDNTTDKLIEQASKEDLDEEMDWEPMNDEEITLEVEVVRAQINRENCVDDRNHIPGNTVELTQSVEAESLEKGPLHIVVDTNVFLTNLAIVEEARDTVFKNYPRPFIIIPWTVICELDYFKENKSKYELRMKARKAISFINEHFSAKHPRVIGQTREQAAQNKEDFSLNCPDDEILQCCLQIQKLGKSVVLLSYDKNLSTKAMVYNILALGRRDPLEKINLINIADKVTNHLTNDSNEHSLFTEELLLADSIFEDTKALIKDFLSFIIVKQMAEIYGESEWQIYVFIKPPWTIVTALKCAIKHWIAAINESFQKHAESIIKDLLHAFENAPTGGRKLQDVECILEKCSGLVQTVNTNKHCELMTQTFDAVTELKKRCCLHMTDMDQKKLRAQIGAVESVQEQEVKAEKAFESFQYIYNYARDICGLACSIVGMPCSFNYRPLNPPISQMAVQNLRPEITKKINDLTRNLNKLLVQAENSIKYETMHNLQENLNTFLPDAQRMACDVEIIDVYYCVQLKKDILQNGLRQLQELSTHFCALANRT